MLTNAYLLAKIGADTAENEQHFAEILPKTGNYLHRRARTGPVLLLGTAAAEGDDGRAVEVLPVGVDELGAPPICQFLAKNWKSL